MKLHLMPDVTLESIENTTTFVSGGGLSVDVEFGSTNDYVEAFKAMAEKISDETLIDILKERDPEYLAEDYR
ncbi:hypothetical protein LQM11_001195 [Vibrio parahaemolyticus]|nr:hypothetical protein [Vibrio parahaemolyticus]EIO4560639.1 hypothetical protein [Vibrio parahaemolyticus]